jgi:hypothetical protein
LSNITVGGGLDSSSKVVGVRLSETMNFHHNTLLYHPTPPLRVFGELGGERSGHRVDALHHPLALAPTLQPLLEARRKLIRMPPPDAPMVRQLHLARAAVPPGVAVRVEFESKLWKPVFHFIGSKG